MISGFLISQIFAFCTFLLDCITFAFKGRKIILAIMVVSTIFLSLHYYFLGKILASSILIVSILRFIVSYFSTFWIWKWVFISLAFSISLYTFDQIIDIIPFLVSCLFTLGAFQKKDKDLRVFFIIAGSLLFVYDFLIFSPMGMFLEAVFVVSGIYGYFKYYPCKQLKI